MENLTEEEVLEMLADKHRFQDVGKIVHIGIIDFLTSYTCAKKIEKSAKKLTADASKISVADPNFYGERFKTWMRDNVLKD